MLTAQEWQETLLLTFLPHFFLPVVDTPPSFQGPVEITKWHSRDGEEEFLKEENNSKLVKILYDSTILGPIYWRYNVFIL